MIDDDQDDFLFFRTIIEQRYETCQMVLINNSTSVADTLSQLGIFPDILLIDLNMPVKNGFIVLSELRSDPIYQNTPIVIFTGSDDPVSATQAFALGATLYLKKPSGRHALEDLVDYQLRPYLM